MIQLIVPRFFENFTFYNLLFQFIRNYPNKLKFNLNLLMSGSIPNTIWNGGINSTNEKIVLFNQLNNILNNTKLPIILDFSNCLLEDFDINDTYGNLILKTVNSGGHMVNITSPILHNYILQNYPEYNCILSKNIFYLHNIQNIDHFNQVLKSNQFTFVELPIEQNINEIFLSSINNPNKIIISLINKCESCRNLNSCTFLENEFQLKYSSKTILDKCSQQTINYSNENILKQLIDYYQTFSISTFQLDSPPEEKLKDFNYFLIINLIQKEYIKDFYKFLQEKDYSL